jgi:hypothetical protein
LGAAWASAREAAWAAAREAAWAAQKTMFLCVVNAPTEEDAAQILLDAMQPMKVAA